MSALVKQWNRGDDSGLSGFILLLANTWELSVLPCCVVWYVGQRPFCCRLRAFTVSGLTLQCTSPSPVNEAGCVLDCRAWTQLIATYLAATVISSDTIQEVDLHIFTLLSPSSDGVSGLKVWAALRLCGEFKAAGQVSVKINECQMLPDLKLHQKHMWAEVCLLHTGPALSSLFRLCLRAVSFLNCLSRQIILICVMVKACWSVSVLTTTPQIRPLIDRTYVCGQHWVKGLCFSA